MAATVERTVVLDDAVEVAVVMSASGVCGFHGSAGGPISLPNLDATARADLKVNLVVEHKEGVWAGCGGSRTDVLDHGCSRGRPIGLPEFLIGAVG